MSLKTNWLTKSLFQSGRQCHKRLWLEAHHTELTQQPDARERRLAQGACFGEFVREQLGGVLADAAPYERDKALAQTRGYLDSPPSHVPILFEAAFEHESVFVRIDALIRFPLADRLIEVKAATRPKDEYFWDCAIQTWVARGAGRPVQHIGLCLVDSSFVYTEEGNYKGLLNIDDYTEQVEVLLPQVPGIVDELNAVVTGEQPRIATGSHCVTPYPCPFFGHCRAAEPPAPAYPVESLRAPALVHSLHKAGYPDLRGVPEELLDRPKHKRIVAAAKSGAAVASPEFDVVLAAIPYPRYYLDFETISFVVPRWLGTKPYQQIPFQFSCHIEQRDGAMEHREHLDLSGASPIEAFADALLAAVGNRGAILVWNQSFEETRVRELAKMLPDRAEMLLAQIDRMVDLLPIYREHYYHRDMHGSWSIKDVLPTVAPELDYSNLVVHDGGAAQASYREAIDATTSTERREGLRVQLLAYCERDTLAMVRLTKPF
jgi:hypothetical protein